MRVYVDNLHSSRIANLCVMWSMFLYFLVLLQLTCVLCYLFIGGNEF